MTCHHLLEKIESGNSEWKKLKEMDTEAVKTGKAETRDRDMNREQAERERDSQ